MKVFIIKNKISQDTYVVKNKKSFCKKFNLTSRLLDYTIKGASANRYQPWHKNFQIVEKLNFIESKDGDMILWDNGLKGYCKRENETHYTNKSITVNSDLQRENELLRNELKKVLKQKQKFQDQLNLNKKLGREQYRYENFVDVLKDVFSNTIIHNKPVILNRANKKSDEIAMLTLSDLHFGQLVKLPTNYFDSEVADLRLGKIFDEFIYEVEKRGVKDVYIALLGDLIHAQSVSTKPDMKLSGEFPEVQATIYAFQIISKYIDKLVEKYNVNICGIVGNESRFSNHLLPSNLQSEARNNMDVVIFEFLKQRYRGYKNVVFVNNGDEMTDVINIKGKNIVLCHGNNLSHSSLEKSVLGLRNRLASAYGEIDFVVLGHIHSTMIGDKYARNASLVGSNAYSDSLGIVESTVSQNMLIISEDIIRAYSLNVD